MTVADRIREHVAAARALAIAEVAGAEGVRKHLYLCMIAELELADERLDEASAEDEVDPYPTGKAGKHG